MPLDQQRQCFERAPPGKRKVVLSTNIAETSITVPDVEFVLDTGRAKETSFDPSRETALKRPGFFIAGNFNS